jgi:hypothetical protein
MVYGQIHQYSLRAHINVLNIEILYWNINLFLKKLNILCELIFLNKYLLFLEFLTCALRTQVNKTLYNKSRVKL